MKGKVFIAWSGNNELAKAVSRQLALEQYEGIVGGQSGSQNDFFVGAAVIREIKYCNQAIFIIQKKDVLGISGNLLFELGYSLSRFDGHKIHVFYVDIDQNSPLIPTDISGIWAHPIAFTDEQTTAKEISELFLMNQKTTISKNKMFIIDSYYKQKEKISQYCNIPYCSEYEFAQYILFFSVSAYMFRHEGDALTILNDITDKIINPCRELEQALSFGKNYLACLKAIKKDEARNVIYLDRSDFRKIETTMNNILATVESWDDQDSDFCLWFKAMINDIKNYMYILYSEMPGIDDKTRELLLKKAIPYAQNCIALCKTLEQKAENEQCVSLFNAYMFRNLALIYEKLYGIEKNEEYLEENAENLKKSLEHRKSLWVYYKDRRINARLFANFELEYYLALSEYIQQVDDALEKSEIKKDCIEYVSHIKDEYKEKNFFVTKIERLVSK